METTNAPPRTAPAEITPAQVQQYQADGFIRMPSVIDAEEVEQFRAEAIRLGEQHEPRGSVFQQIVNVWRESAVMRALTLHPNIAAIAQKLAQAPLRLWHDHVLIKHPGVSTATEFHQDQPYWPHRNSTNPISAWVALVDVPPEKGCMSFIPKSHHEIELPAQNLRDDRSLFSLCPELEWKPRVTLPLRAGDCTFHHGRCAHMATPNLTPNPRVAHVMIYMDAATHYTGREHVVTNPLNLTEGDALTGELFPTFPLSEKCPIPRSTVIPEISPRE